MQSQFPGAVPEIPVRDIDEALAYYEGSLGFTVDWGDGDLGLAGISRGDCRLFLASAEYRKGYGNVGPVMTWLNLDSKDAVDDLYRAWHAGRTTILRSAPESKPWGLHEFTAADPDGNLFRVFYDVATPENARS
jgi:catechol 2,3-dioxygenase-like lactoylglutathione lyase family enzyme